MRFSAGSARAMAEATEGREEVLTELDADPPVCRAQGHPKVGAQHGQRREWNFVRPLSEYDVTVGGGDFDGSGTAADVLQLVARVEETVMRRFDVRLVREFVDWSGAARGAR